MTTLLPDGASGFGSQHLFSGLIISGASVSISLILINLTLLVTEEPAAALRSVDLDLF